MTSIVLGPVGLGLLLAWLAWSAAAEPVPDLTREPPGLPTFTMQGVQLRWLREESCVFSLTASGLRTTGRALGNSPFQIANGSVIQLDGPVTCVTDPQGEPLHGVRATLSGSTLELVRADGQLTRLALPK